MRAKIGVIGNLGGGTGKSTLSCFFLSYVKSKGKRALLIDTDLQGSAEDKYNYDLKNGYRKSDLFDVIHIHSKNAFEIIQKNIENYDYILLDVPPNIEQEGVLDNMNLLDFVIIPTHHGNFSKSQKYFSEFIKINEMRVEKGYLPTYVKFALYMMPKLRPTEIAEFEREIIENGLSDYFLRSSIKHYDKAMYLPSLMYRMEDKSYYPKIDLMLSEIYNNIEKINIQKL